MDDYKLRKSIQEQARLRKPITLSNRNEYHAALVMVNFFKGTAKNEQKHRQPTIRIYGENFDGTISGKGNYLLALNNYIRKHNDTQLLILCKENPRIEARFNAYNTILRLSKEEEYKDRVKVRYLKNSEAVDEVFREYDESPNFFATSTEGFFRKEISEKRFEAEYSFNHPRRANALTRLFDELFQNHCQQNIIYSELFEKKRPSTVGNRNDFLDDKETEEIIIKEEDHEKIIKKTA